MAKKKSLGKFPVDSKVRVKPGVPSPEFPEITLEGWSGTVCEVSGKGDAIRYVIEWDQTTLSAMPAEYLQKCEQDGLFHAMACLGEDTLEACSG